MKKSIIIVLVLFSTGVYSQVFRPLFSAVVDKNIQFENNGYLNLATGVELKAAKFFQPQIEFGYTKALLYEDNTYDLDFKINSVSQAQFESYSLAFTPKLLVYRDKNGYYSFNILPKYTYSQVASYNDYAIVEPDGDVVLPYKTSASSANLHSFGIGLGFCVNFGKKNYDSMAINLYWNNIEYGTVLNNLNNMSTTIDTSSIVGFGLVYYISLKDNIEKGFIEPK